MSSNLKPRYSVWEGIKTALDLGRKALEEVQALKRVPGPQGLGWDDMEEILEDDGRTIVRRYKRGDEVKEFRHKMSAMIYRGVYRDDQVYDRGDTVTYGGQMSHCDKDGTVGVKPDSNGTIKAWTLCSKKGRDGKDAKAA